MPPTSPAACPQHLLVFDAKTYAFLGMEGTATLNVAIVDRVNQLP
jgi:hypothetical protein